MQTPTQSVVTQSVRNKTDMVTYSKVFLLCVFPCPGALNANCPGAFWTIWAAPYPLVKD